MRAGDFHCPVKHTDRAHQAHGKLGAQKLHLASREEP